VICTLKLSVSNNPSGSPTSIPHVEGNTGLKNT
jgi:hypothetical protein